MVVHHEEEVHLMEEAEEAPQAVEVGVDLLVVVPHTEVEEAVDLLIEEVPHMEVEEAVEAPTGVEAVEVEAVVASEEEEEEEHRAKAKQATK